MNTELCIKVGKLNKKITEMLMLEEKQCMTAVLCLYCATVNEHPLSGEVRVQLGKL